MPRSGRSNRANISFPVERFRTGEKILVSILLAIVLFAPVAFGQAVQSGTVRGFILDPSKATVPGAQVTITSDTKLINRSIDSGIDGGYLFQSLPPGNYEVLVERAGFGKWRQTGAVLHSGDNLRIDVDLVTATMNASVEVKAESGPPINTINANLNVTVPGNQIRDMLMPANQVTRVALFLPGAVSEWVQNGREALQLTMTVDGVNDGDEYQSGGGWQFNPPPDAVAEFRVTKDNYTAELGRSSGVRLEFVTKSGTNQFHGTLFGFIQNAYFNAKNWGSTTRANTRYGEYGYTVGGPIIKQRVFFQFSNYYMRSNTPASSYVTWPTAAQHNGDFSAWLNPPAGLSRRVIRDPAAGQPFAGNIIPSSRLDRNAVAYLNLFYPSISNPNALSNNSYVTSPVIANDNYFSPRIDFRVTDKLNMYLRAMYDHRYQTFSYLSPPDKLHPDSHTTGGPNESVTRAALIW